MTKTLVLIRHGKPEPVGADTPDELRELTTEGLRALKGPNGLSRTLGMLSEQQRADAVIWSSPAVRAQQTAQVVSSVLDNRAIEDHACLWEQDPVAFMNEVAEAPTDCVIAIGHIPFMDKIAELLTGAQLPFKPGAAAAIELAETNEPAASRLHWFVQGPEASTQNNTPIEEK